MTGNPLAAIPVLLALVLLVFFAIDEWFIEWEDED